MRYKVTTKKLSAGHFKVTVFDNERWEEVGSFDTTDSMLVDNISEGTYSIIDIKSKIQ
jgi:hypothetical protein